jgi:hypothetical protein
MSKIVLMVRGASKVEVAATTGGISIKNGVFSVVVPMHDWWDHTEDFRFVAGDLLSENIGDVFDFANDVARQRFHAWLLETMERAKQGYRTMYP